MSIALAKLYALSLSVFALLSAMAEVPSATAQCVPDWQSVANGGIASVNGDVKDMILWDPDGAGSAPELLVICGEFSITGSMENSNLAAWDGSAWHSIGGGVDGPAFALGIYNNQLIVAGAFANAGGSPVSPNIAAWTGSAWQSLGNGLDGQVSSITLHGENLVAGGVFTHSGVTGASHVASWNGSAWSALGAGLNDRVNAVTVYGGDLHAGGVFVSSGTTPIGRLARWTGSAWQQVGAGVDKEVYALTAHDGLLVAGGLFSVTASSVTQKFVAGWNGSAWVSVGGGQKGAVRTLAVCGGQLYATGEFGHRAAVLDGTWKDLFGGYGGPDEAMFQCFELYHGDLYMGGKFFNVDGLGVRGIVRRHGTTWELLDHALNSSVLAMTQFRGNLVVAGSLSALNGVDGFGAIASWNGSAWSKLGQGLAGLGNEIVAAMVEFDGDLIVAGSFKSAGGLPAARIARWDGSSWHTLGSGIADSSPFASVNALAVYNGDLFAGGEFTAGGGSPGNGIARWDGSAWHPLGAGVQQGEVYALAVYNGRLVVGGAFTKAGPMTIKNIAQWDGASWSSISGGEGAFTDVLALRVHNGDLIVGGKFKLMDGMSMKGVARWDGSAWHAMSDGLWGGLSAVHAFGTMSGELVATGRFDRVEGASGANIAAWNGTAWYTLGTEGLDATYGRFSYGRAIESFGGDLFVGGIFYTAGGNESPYLARWGCVCRADFDHSGFADSDDFAAFVAAFDAGLPSADVDGSGFVDTDDFSFFVGLFEAGC